jgi:hypothetical protein
MSFAEFCTYAGSTSGKPEVARAHKALDVVDLRNSDLPDDTVEKAVEIGYVVEVPHEIYNEKEFLKFKGVEMSKVKLKPNAKIMNERGEDEDVLVVRKKEPRRLIATMLLTSGRRTKVNRHVLRHGQGDDTFRWLTENHLKSRAFSNPRKKLLDTKGLDKIVRKHIRGLEGGGGEGADDGNGNNKPKVDKEKKKALPAPTWGSGNAGSKKEKHTPRKKKRQPGDGGDEDEALPVDPKSKSVTATCGGASSSSTTLDFPGVSFSKPGVDMSKENARGSHAGRSVVGGPAGSVVGSVKSLKGVCQSRETYFNFTAIMEGTQKGQAKAGAQRHLGALMAAKVPDTNAINRLETELKCYDKCALLVPDKIHSTPVTTIQKNIKDVRLDLGIECPLCVHAVLVQKWAEFLVQREKWDDIGSMLRIWTGDTPSVYKVDSPTLHSLLKKFEYSKESVDASILVLRAVAFGNKVVDLFAEATDGGVGQPYYFAEGILKQYTELECLGDEKIAENFKEIPDELAETYDEVCGTWPMLYCQPGSVASGLLRSSTRGWGSVLEGIMGSRQGSQGRYEAGVVRNEGESF